MIYDIKWNKLALICSTMGIIMYVQGLLTTDYSTDSADYEFFLITAFLTYSVGYGVQLTMQTGGIPEGRILYFLALGLLAMTGLFILIGIPVYTSKGMWDRNPAGPPPFWISVMVMSMLCAISSSACMVLNLVTQNSSASDTQAVLPPTGNDTQATSCPVVQQQSYPSSQQHGVQQY